MKNFIEKLRTDEAFAAEFLDAIHGADSEVKECIQGFSEQLDKLVMKAILEFASSHNMTIQDDEAVKKQITTLSKQIGLQLDEMVVKQFKGMAIVHK